MNDEIKEIDRIIINVKRKLQFSPERRFVELFNKDEIKKLLDYITNLQEELEEYKDTETYSKRFLYKANKDRLNANLDLVKENERLKELVNPKTQVFIDTQDMEERYGEELYKEYLEKQAKEYKSRCEKAIEYIMSELVDEWSIKNDGHVHGSDLPVDAITPILDILNGRSE